jgi:hypothetical protein
VEPSLTDFNTANPKFYLEATEKASWDLKKGIIFGCKLEGKQPKYKR